MGNVLAALPKSAQPGARAALAEIYNAESKEHARKAVKVFEDLYGAKWPKAVAKITDDLDVLLAFYDFPPSTGSTYGPRTRSSPRSPPSGFGPGSPRGPAPGPPASRWRSSSSSPHKPDGERSTHLTSSHWSEPEPYSRTANSSNDPTNQVVISKSRNTHRSTSLDHSSADRYQRHCVSHALRVCSVGF